MNDSLLPHSVLPEDAEICLITKDPQREYKDAIEAQGVKRISKVCSISEVDL